MPPCDFAAGLDGQVGPFLVWDGGAPAGYVGDPTVEHTVTGSPTGANLFRVEGPDVGGPGVNVIETDLFAVQGRVARPRGTVDLPGDLYVTGQRLTLDLLVPGRVGDPLHHRRHQPEEQCHPVPSTAPRSCRGRVR